MEGQNCIIVKEMFLQTCWVDGDGKACSETFPLQGQRAKIIARGDNDLYAVSIGETVIMMPEEFFEAYEGEI